MNAKATLALVGLAGIAGIWYWKGDAWAPSLGIRTPYSEPVKSPATGALDALTPAGIAKIEISFPSGEPLVLERASTGSGWKLPGNWPLRRPEVEELVETLGTLRTRFHPISMPEGNDPARFGLAADQKPLVVKLTADRQLLTLTFGEPKSSVGETSFTSPAYVRVNDSPEVLRLGPDVMSVLRRPPEAYRRRSLFPDIERVKLAGGAASASPFGESSGDAPVTVSLPGEETTLIRVARNVPTIWNLDLSPNVSFTLVRQNLLPQPAILSKGGEAAVPSERLADAWALDTPVRNRAEPAQLRQVLAAISGLWADSFAGTDSIDMRLAATRLLSIPVDRLPIDVRTGFANATESVTVERKSGDTVTIRFGGIAKIVEREETTMIPGGPPGAPPRPITSKVHTTYRFARVEGNPQIFVVSAEKLPDLFVSTASLIEPQVARFARDEVREIVLQPSGRTEVRLSLTKGDSKSTKPEEQQDRWFLDAKPNPLLADTARVNELLDQLTAFRASSPDRTSFPASPPAAATIVTLITRDKRAQGEPDGPERKLTLVVGKPNYATRQMSVRLDGWPRVTLVDDSIGPDDRDSWVTGLLFPKTLSDLLGRPALAYRNRNLFDSAADLAAVSVAGQFSLRRDSAEWKLTGPITSDADSGKAGEFASALAGLAATDFVTETATVEELKSFGLDAPKHTVNLEFKGGRAYTLELGTPRPGKSEVFARLDRGAVFALPNTVLEHLTTGVVGLLPLKVWSAQPDKISSLEISRTDAPDDSFKLAKEGSSWRVNGPFSASVTSANAQPLLLALGNLTAAKYQALTSTNPVEYGFDKPLLTVKLTHTETPPANDGLMNRAVVVGAPTSDGAGRYARLEGPNAPVFVVPAAFVDAARTPALDLLDRTLLSLDPTRIAKVRITPQTPEDTFTLSKDASGKWSTAGATFAIDGERVSRLTSAAARPSVAKLVAYGDAVKWADFGLEKAAVTIGITLDGDKSETHTIELGKADPLGGRYARIDGGKAVAVIPNAVADSLARKKFDFADRSLLSFDPTTLVGIVRKLGKEELELAPGAALGWDIIKPAKQKADQQLVDELAEALGRLRAERVAAYGKKEAVFKEHGLEAPAASITVTLGERAEQKTLRIGNHVNAVAQDGDRYVAVESPSAEVIVGVLPASLVIKLLAPPVAFRDRSLARFVDADKAVLERGDRKITFAKIGVTWKVVEPISATAESAELETLVADLGKLRADTWIAERKGTDLKSFGLDRPTAKWTLSNGDSTVLVLLIGTKAADGRAHVTTDKGELIGLLDRSLTERLSAEYRQRKPWDVDAAQVAEIEIAAHGGKFVLEKVGQAWTDPTKPTDSIDAKPVNDLLGALAALRVERYAIDRNADPKLFGLEKPEVTVSITAAGARQILEIGGAVGGTTGKQRYARVVDKDRTDVFVLTPSDTAILTRDRSSYLLKK